MSIRFECTSLPNLELCSYMYTALDRAYYFDILVIRTELSNAKMIRTLPESFIENLFTICNRRNNSFIALTENHWHGQATTCSSLYRVHTAKCNPYTFTC